MVADSATSVDLLHRSAETAGAASAFERLLSGLVDRVGPATTVWGAKATAAGDQLWELYWYDDHPDRRALAYDAVSPVLQSATDFAAVPAVDEALPYVSFSFDVVADDGRVTTTGSTLYFGESADGGRSVGLSYAVGSTGLELRNVYQVFPSADAAELRRLDRYLQRGVFGPDAPDGTLRWRTALPCETVILARKPRNEALYFRRCALADVVALDEFRFFPADLVAWTEANTDRFDHLWFDVGIDYERRDGVIRPLQIGVFGFV